MGLARGQPRTLQHQRRVDAADKAIPGQHTAEQIRLQLEASSRPWAKHPPRKLDPATIAVLANAIEAGVSVSGAARLVKISRRTFHDWLARAEGQVEPYATFADVIAQAEGTYEHSTVTILHQLAIAKGDARTLLEVLRRRFPDEWGRAEKLTVEATAEHSIDPALQNALQLIKHRNQQETP